VRVSFGCAREYGYLTRMIGTRKNLFQAADTAFLLSEASISNVISKIHKSGIEIEKPSIAVALRSKYFWTYPERYGTAKFFLFVKKIAKSHACASETVVFHGPRY